MNICIWKEKTQFTPQASVMIQQATPIKIKKTQIHTNTHHISYKMGAPIIGVETNSETPTL